MIDIGKKADEIRSVVTLAVYQGYGENVTACLSPCYLKWDRGTPLIRLA